MAISLGIWKDKMMRHGFSIPALLCFIFIWIQHPNILLAQPNRNLSEFTPGTIWPDNNGIHINAHGGGILYHGNKYYWYGEHKIDGEAGNTAQEGFHCYSSSALYNWTDEGIVLKVSYDSSSPIFKGCIMERPKVIYNNKTKQFVMWFHHELFGSGYGDAMSGIASSHSPTGPFQYIKSIRPNAGQWPLNKSVIHNREIDRRAYGKFCGGPNCMPVHPDTINILKRDFEKGQMARDMNLYVDENGKAYHIYASEENSTMHIAELTDDYLNHSNNWVRAFINRFMEAPAIFKSKGKYYFIGSGCTGWEPNAARSAVADHIFGPWTELGNPCRGEDSALTFHSQSTYVLPVQGKKETYIFMADRWNPKNAIDGRYIWLPIQFEDGKLLVSWKKKWQLTTFK